MRTNVSKSRVDATRAVKKPQIRQKKNNKEEEKYQMIKTQIYKHKESLDRDNGNTSNTKMPLVEMWVFFLFFFVEFQSEAHERIHREQSSVSLSRGRQSRNISYVFVVWVHNLYEVENSMLHILALVLTQILVEWSKEKEKELSEIK